MYNFCHQCVVETLSNTVRLSVCKILEYTTVDDLLNENNYTDLKKAATGRGIWRILRRHSYKPAK